MAQTTETLSEAMKRLMPHLTHSRPGPDDPIFKEPVTITSRPFTKLEGVSQKSPDIEPEEIDLSSLKDFPKWYSDVVSSELTLEQRQQADRDEIYMCGPIGRIKVQLSQKILPRQWIIEYGWPKVLDKIREYAAENNIKLIEPDAYFTFEVKAPRD